MVVLQHPGDLIRISHTSTDPEANDDDVV